MACSLQKIGWSAAVKRGRAAKSQAPAALQFSGYGVIERAALFQSGVVLLIVAVAPQAFPCQIVDANVIHEVIG